jgi:hypothetical protein
MIKQRGVVRFLWAKNMDAAKDIHKEMLPIWAPTANGRNGGKSAKSRQYCAYGNLARKIQKAGETVGKTQNVRM